MKLSKLEALVYAMREQARLVGNDDPNVEFYEDDRQALLNKHDEGCGFLNMEPHPNSIAELMDHMVRVTGDVAKRGDFAIPLVLC